MKIVIVTCWNYRDCWEPCLRLLNKYWPGEAEKTVLATDTCVPEFVEPLLPFIRGGILQSGANASWGRVVGDAAGVFPEHPILMLQEDFFLNAPVRKDIVARASAWVSSYEQIGAIRLYPCPGATNPSPDEHFGEVSRGTAYRISCQATIWNPCFLLSIASRIKSPSELEIDGTRWTAKDAEQVWAWKREVEPWPIQYICSAVSRGKWNPDALALCKREGIGVDMSLRGVAA